MNFGHWSLDTRYRVLLISNLVHGLQKLIKPFFAAGGLGTRHWVTFMLFLGMANAYIMRTNMSVAIVAMVNHTALPVISEATDTECGEVTSNKTSVSSYLMIFKTVLHRATFRAQV